MRLLLLDLVESEDSFQPNAFMIIESLINDSIDVNTVLPVIVGIQNHNKKIIPSSFSKQSTIYLLSKQLAAWHHTLMIGTKDI
jgi:hypothetical protein